MTSRDYGERAVRNGSDDIRVTESAIDLHFVANTEVRRLDTFQTFAKELNANALPFCLLNYSVVMHSTSVKNRGEEEDRGVRSREIDASEKFKALISELSERSE